MMKKWPLFIQITAAFTGLLLCTSLLLLFFLPITLKNFFTEEIFTTIQNSQQFFYHKNRDLEIGSIDSPQDIQSIRTVNHVVVNSEGKIIKGTKLNPFIISKIITNIESENVSSKKYSIPFQGETIFIVAQKLDEHEKNYYVISFMWDTYRNELVVTLFKRIFFLMGIIIIISIFISSALAKRLTKPIIQMKSHVRKIAKRNWNEPININRSDELGELAKSIEEMRKQLNQQDKAQQEFMQNISHDLKTPVMVIQSYAEAIRDGIFVKGTLEETTEVISEEAKRLEIKIKDLLYLTKLQYLETKSKQSTPFHIHPLLETVMNRVMQQRREVNWDIENNNFKIIGNQEQFEVALENILNNCLRYANGHIKISITIENNYGKVIIWNDGPKIDEDLLKKLFVPFSKGLEGNFGLGLTIAKKVIDSHNGSIDIKNEVNGVAYEIVVPINK
jgi:two-component system, OmpR family, sensor histidine kinase CssS